MAPVDGDGIYRDSRIHFVWIVATLTVKHALNGAYTETRSPHMQ